MPTPAEYAANPEKFKTARRARYALDPEKERAARRAYYSENSAKEKVYNQSPVGKVNRNSACRKHRANLRQKLDLLKMERGCYDCGIMGLPAACYDWDHVTGEKSFNIGPDQGSRSLLKNIEEIGKCQCVCSNCHRIRTMARKKGES